MRKKSWSEEEDSIIREFYPTEGKEITSRLKGRTLAAIRLRAYTLGIKLSEDVFKRNAWSEDDDNIIRSFYPEEGEAVSERLPGRTISAIKIRASKLGVRYRGSNSYNVWTDEENEILNKYYPTEGDAVLKRLPDKDKHQLTGHAYYLGLYQKYHKKKFEVVIWSEEEDRIMREYYPDEGFDVIERLPGRTRNAIKTRASVLGLKYTGSDRRYWNEEELLILKTYFEKEGSKGVYEKLDKRFTRTEISIKANQLGLKNPRIKKEAVTFSDEEIRIITEFYEAEGASGVQKRIGNRHSIRSINRKANVLGLHRNRKYWSAEELKIMKEYYETEGSAGVYERLKKRFSRSEISLKANQMKLKNPNKATAPVPFTDEETRIIIEFYESEGATGIQKRIGSKHGIRNINTKANHLGLHIRDKSFSQ